MSKSKVLLIGPIPPPSGGVSQHVYRLSNIIAKDFDTDFVDESRTVKSDFFNLRSFKLVQYLEKIKLSDLIFIHSGSNLLRIFHLIIGYASSKRIILTIHSYPYSKRLILKYIDMFFFNLADTIITVNSEILSRLSLPSEKCIVKHAFIPPIIGAEPYLPAEVDNWITCKKNNGKLIICANASWLSTFNNQDLYGLDMCIEVTRKLVNYGLPISFIFNVSSLEKGKNLFIKYKSIIRKLELQEDFLLLSEDLSFIRLIEKADIVLRPTNTDGDAITVREALYLGKPVIASDIVNRPTGTTLFKTRDVNDLKNRLLETIISIKEQNFIQNHGCDNEYDDFYLELITNILNRDNK